MYLYIILKVKTYVIGNAPIFSQLKLERLMKFLESGCVFSSYLRVSQINENIVKVCL